MYRLKQTFQTEERHRTWFFKVQYYERMSTRQVQLRDKIQSINAGFPHVPTVTPKQVQDLLLVKQPVVFVDCRSAEERHVSKIRPDAITEREFEQRCDDLQRQGVNVIAYCTIGYRSAQFVAKHKRSDLEIYNLAGSLLAWIDDGYEIWGNGDTGYDHVTRDIHVWGRDFATFVNSEYKPVYFRHPVLHEMARKLFHRG